MSHRPNLITNNGPIRVGIIGLGRSGWNIHAKCIQGIGDSFVVAAVADTNGPRRAEAENELGARTYSDADDLIADPNLDVVVVASPNRLHTPQACAAMQAGKHVVCEKPFGLSRRDADEMIRVSAQTGQVLAPFQNRRYEPHFLKVKQIIDSGQLGRILQIRMVWSHFTRRWDWQTLRSFGGGSLNNHGAHLLDHALQLFGEAEPKVFADLQRSLTLGDTEDHVKLILHGPGSPTIDIESFSSCAYPGERWNIVGTKGGLRGTTESLRWKWMDWETMPKRVVDDGPVQGRIYQKEEYEWHHESWETLADAVSPYVLFYRDLEQTLRNGKPLFITPESVARQISVLEACHAMADATIDTSIAAPNPTKPTPASSLS